jgi:hypothetical protein
MELESKLTLKLTHTHSFFKHPKFCQLSVHEKNIYLSYKLDNYYVLNNQYTDPNGHSQKSYSHNVSHFDYENNVHTIFKDTLFQIYFQKNYPFSENIKKILRNKELETKFQSWISYDIQDMFDYLKEEAKEKKCQEANKIKAQKEEEIKQKELIKKQNQEKIEKQNNHKKELQELIDDLDLDLSDSDNES